MTIAKVSTPTVSLLILATDRELPTVLGEVLKRPIDQSADLRVQFV